MPVTVGTTMSGFGDDIRSYPAQQIYNPQPIALANGNYVVAMTGFFQIFQSNGLPVGGQIPILDEFGYSGSPQIAALANGTFAVTWPGMGAELHAQIFAGNGSPVTPAFNVGGGGATSGGDITALSDGGFVVAWLQAGANSSVDVHFFRFDAAGNPVGAEVVIDAPDFVAFQDAQILGLADGGFVVSWQRQGGPVSDPSSYNVYAQIFDSSNTPGPAFLVNSTLDGQQNNASMTLLSNGNFVVVWRDTSSSGAGEDVPEIRGQIFDAAGNKVGGELQINQTFSDFQDYPSVTALQDGGFFVAWDENDYSTNPSTVNVEGRRFNADGTPAGDEFVISRGTDGNQYTPEVTTLANGNVIAVWMDYRSGTQELFSRILGVADSVGDAADDTITGSAAEEWFQGGAGADQLTGGAGNDLLEGGDGNDVLDGGSDSDALAGGVGDDSLDGGAGTDRMEGGAGNDTYVVDHAGDLVVENVGQGNDRVLTSISFTLPENVETLYLTGTANIDAAGNDGANNLYGNSGNNRLDGGLGADRLSGGDGNDTYYIDDEADRALESSATGGLDTVYSSISLTLAYQYLERLFLSGTDAINATGNSLNNTLVGNSAANILDGVGGTDVMNGGAGNDTYLVDQTGDTVIEVAGGGTDTVLSSATFALSRSYEIENLTLTGYSAVNAYGNHLANVLTGNDNNNILNGSTGADVMAGKGNNDIYFVDNQSDVVIEEANGAVDTIHTSVSYVLPDHVENIGMVGEEALNLTGNNLSNRLFGNSADNILDGAAGADYMTGRGGNDTYIVDDVNDRVLETRAIDGDADKILSSVSYGLGGIYIETLELTGTAEIDATGNTLANTLIGNEAANDLYGKGGNDSLTGGAGADGFWFDTALNGTTNVDAILDFSVADDTIYLRRGVFSGIAADGTLDASAFRAGTAAQDADDRIVYDSATGNIWYDADGSGSEAQVLFATVTAGTALTHLDFTVYTPG